jgi:hypothetical protein
MEEATISVKLTFWERYRVTAFLWFRTFRWFLLPVSVVTVTFFVLLAYVAFFPTPEQSFHQLAASFGATPYLMLAISIFFTAAPLLFVALNYSNPRIREASQYKISEFGVAIEHPVGNANLKWEAFTRAIETKTFFLVFVPSGLAHTWPKRAFVDQGTARFVRELLRRNLKKTKLRTQ